MTVALLQALKKEQASNYGVMKELLDQMHSREDKKFTAEEEERYEKAQAAYDVNEEKIEMVQKNLEREKKLASLELDLGKAIPEKEESGIQGAGKETSALIKTPDFLKCATEQEFKEFASAIDTLMQSSGKKGLKELAHLQVLPEGQGGALVVPAALRNYIIKGIDDAAIMRQLGTVVTLTGAESLDGPTLEADAEDHDWTGELLTGNNEDTLAFGHRKQSPNPLAKRLKISKKLIKLRPNASEFAIGRLQYKQGITQEKAFLTGHGANQPLGAFTASDKGISTSRDIAGSNTTTVIAADTLFDMFFGLKEGYASRGTWLMHRLILKAIRKLKDQNDQYLWQPGLANGSPATILDRPYRLSEFAPSTLSASQYVALFGDFSYYEIVETNLMELQILNELYAETNQVGVIMRTEVDGAPVLEEAFTRMIMAAS